MKNLLLILVLIGTSVLSAQIKGKVTYKISTKKDSLDQPYANPENTDAKNEVLEMMHESLPVEGYLVFNDSISIYNVEPKNDIPEWNNSNDNLTIESSGINLTWFMAGGNSIYYTDLSRDFAITQNAIMGPTVRIISKPVEWTITDETKEIDGYTCYLATKDKLKNKKLRAWFTPKITVKHGPKGFNGLPGLIMEIEDVIYTWKIVKIDFNNKEADVIVEPLEGDLMTQKEFVNFSGNIFSDN
ncbi:GLPGLI family protein [Winogradskyella sp. UBA3174]|uniref:GLPGLI family protein n=1 Tax=Winogradskyella sp. UBA3174 TaxID=1947785 RepID=UPI0025CB9375|nr:GLPGLI family protein [Winogradskyella sp. UBA3174]|tara:strand:+ start:42853 stop:43581 length:729 start_codon:yes stop_codon:yes gene_type:complete